MFEKLLQGHSIVKELDEEIKKMFYKMVKNWFGKDRAVYNGFVRALLIDDLEEMADSMFSIFDGGNKTIGKEDPGAVLSWICAGTAGGSCRAL